MSEQPKNMNHYSLADIEQYLQGKLSPAEMHELEKAAVQDPFLADAIEGYQSTDLTLIKQDLADIHNRLSSEPAKIIPAMAKRNTWWRVAAAVILLAGTGIFGWKLFTVKNNTQELAKLETIVPLQKDPAQTVALITSKKDAASAMQKNDLLAKNNEPLRSLKKNSVTENFASYDKKSSQPVAVLSAKSYVYHESSIAKDTALFDKIVTKDLVASNSYTGRTQGLPAQINNENGATRFLYKGANTTQNSKGDNINTISANGIVTIGRGQTSLPVSVNKGNKIKMDTVSFEREYLPGLPKADLKAGESSITALGHLSSLSVAGNVTSVKRNGILIDTPFLIDQKQMHFTFAENKPVTLSGNGPTFNASKTKKDSVVVLPEVTVIGYGTTSKKEVTGSVSSTNATKVSSRGTGDLGISVNPTGGWYNFTKYLTDKIASDAGIKKEIGRHGSVEIKMNISAKGKVSKVSIVKSFDTQLNHTLIKAIRKGPLWKSSDHLEKKGFIFKVNL